MAEPESQVQFRSNIWAAGFTAVPNAVLDSGLTARAKLLYIMLLHYAWQDGECFPGQERLAADLDRTDRQIRRLLSELKEAGLLETRRRGLGQTNVYVIIEPRPDENVRSGPDIAPRPDTGVRSGPDTGVRSRRGSDVRSLVDEDPVEEDTEEKDTEEEEEVETVVGEVVPDTQVDQTSLLHEAHPVGFTEVREKLHEVSKLHSAPRDKDEAIESAMGAYPDKDAVAVADDLLFWAKHGNGSRKKIKSVAGTYRNFLKRADVPDPESSERPGEGKMAQEARMRAAIHSMKGVTSWDDLQ